MIEKERQKDTERLKDTNGNRLRKKEKKRDRKKDVGD